MPSSKKTTIITVGDVHLADKNPAMRIDNYRDNSFFELGLVRTKAVEEKADFVAFTGDIFDEKSPHKNSHGLVASAVQMFKSYPCNRGSVIGNHDITHNRLESMHKQPLQVLFEAGCLTKIDRMEIGDVDLVGVHFSEENSYDTFANIKKKKDRPLVAIIHALASKSGGDLFGEIVFSYKKLAKVSDIDVFVFGHWHQDQGIETIGDKTFVNLGALARGALSKENVFRQVKLGKIVWDGKKFECEELPLAVKKAEEIFDLDKKEQMDKREDEIADFVSSLNKKDLFADISSIEDTIREMALEAPVQSRLVQYLNNRGAGLKL